MKMPTKRTNTKHNFLAIGGIAAVVGLTPVATTFAHGGFSDTDGSRASTTDQRSGDKWLIHGHLLGHSHDWWHVPSLESFTKHNDAKLALIDKAIARYDLTIENGETLRASIDTKAGTVEAALTAYQQLKTELDSSNTTPTDEQKAQLKEATMAALSALYDYREAMHDYVSAVIEAFKAKWDDTDKLKQFKQGL